MPSYDYGITVADVLESLPSLASTNISATTVPLNTGDIEAQIDSGAARFNGVLINRGVTPSADLDADTHATIKQGVINYAAANALFILNRTGTDYENAQERWQQLYAEISNRPESLAAYSPSIANNSPDVDENYFAQTPNGVRESITYIGLSNEDLF